jgi:hypothetical protein
MSSVRTLLVSMFSLAFPLLSPLLSVAPAAAQTDTQVLDRAARALRSDPVYVDPSAERRIDGAAADRLRQRIRDRGSAIFLAVLPGSAVTDAGGDASDLASTLGQRVGLAGTVGVVAGESFRGASNVLPPGRAGALSTAAFQARSAAGTEAVLAEFVDRVSAVQGTAAPSGSGDRQFDDGGSGGDGDGGGGSSALPALLLVGAAGGGFYLWQRSKKQRREDAVREEADRSLLRAEVSVLAEDVMRLEPQIALHPDALPDYEAAVSRYRVAQAALERTDGIDLVRVERVLAEGTYAMDRVKARIDGREPPPPPEDLTRRGRHDEPAMDLDERGEPMYVGYGSPFYGGGWFGGGGGLLTGLFLGQMLGGWGGGYHEQNVYVEDSGGGGDGGWGGGGGGDWGGGGGDWGGGDVGGGDWG